MIQVPLDTVFQVIEIKVITIHFGNSIKYIDKPQPNIKIFSQNKTKSLSVKS